MARVPEQGTPAGVRDEADPGEKRRGWLRLSAVEAIRKMILSGELPPGGPLREVALSEELGMSRTPIREAFRTLAAEGLVNLLPNRSVVVNAPDGTAAADVFTVLGALEALAGQLACRRMTDAEIDALGRLQDELERYFEKRDRLSYLEINRLIHEHLVEGSRSPSLILVWRMLLPRAERARHVTTLDHARWAEAFEEHRHIYAAVRARDEALLRRLLQEHFANGIPGLLRDKDATDAPRAAIG